MRHRKSGRKLGRDTAHRKALFINLARSFFSNQGKVTSTLAKLRAVQPKIEKMITLARKADLVSRRRLYRYFQDQDFVNQVVEKFGKKLEKSPGGYTRIVKLKKRRGDNATVARLELVK